MEGPEGECPDGPSAVGEAVPPECCMCDCRQQSRMDVCKSCWPAVMPASLPRCGAGLAMANGGLGLRVCRASANCDGANRCMVQGMRFRVMVGRATGLPTSPHPTEPVPPGPAHRLIRGVSRRYDERTAHVDGVMAAHFPCELARVRATTPPMIIALVNSKGGVGKSTLAGNLIGWLHEHGKSVILAEPTSSRIWPRSRRSFIIWFAPCRARAASS